MPITSTYSGSVSWDAIRSFILSGRAPKTSMGVSRLDGFLTAVAIGPDLIMPSEWLPIVWGGGDAIFDDLDEASSISSLVVTRLEDMVSSFQTGSEGWAPVFWEAAQSEVNVADWAAGFLDAVNMCLEAWFPLFEDREAAVLAVPILLVGGEQAVAKELGIGPSEQGEWLRQADRHIPMAVTAIDAFWKQRRMLNTPTRSRKRRSRRLRRQDSFPSGSAKEHMRYCVAH